LHYGARVLEERGAQLGVSGVSCGFHSGLREVKKTEKSELGEVWRGKDATAGL
jgi:hypothetical protein